MYIACPVKLWSKQSCACFSFAAIANLLVALFCLCILPCWVALVYLARISSAICLQSPLHTTHMCIEYPGPSKCVSRSKASFNLIDWSLCYIDNIFRLWYQERQSTHTHTHTRLRFHRINLSCLPWSMSQYLIVCEWGEKCENFHLYAITQSFNIRFLQLVSSLIFEICVPDIGWIVEWAECTPQPLR